MRARTHKPSLIRWLVLPAALAAVVAYVVLANALPQLSSNNLDSLIVRSPTPVEPSTVAADEIRRQLTPARSTIEIDQDMAAGQTYEATLIIERATGNRTLEIVRQTPQPVADVISINVSDELYAVANSKQMKITANSPDWQSIAPSATAVWSWTIEPRQAGPASVEFTLYQKVLIDGGETVVFVDRYPRTITVTVSAWRSVRSSVADFVIQPITFLSSLVGLLTGIFAFQARLKRQRRASRGSPVAEPEETPASTEPTASEKI